jgi:hypothetical protein
MSGTAVQTGDAPTGTSSLQYAADIITALGLAFNPSASPTPIEAPPVANPNREISIAGMGIGTLALVAIAVIVGIKVLK